MLTKNHVEFRENDSKYRTCCIKSKIVAQICALVEILSAISVVCFFLWEWEKARHANTSGPVNVTSVFTSVALACSCIFFTALMCAGVRVQWPELVLAHLVMQFVRIVVFGIFVVLYIVWTGRRRTNEDHFWLLTLVVPVALLMVQVFYFRVVRKTYAYVRDKRRADKAASTVAKACCTAYGLNKAYLMTPYMAKALEEDGNPKKLSVNCWLTAGDASVPYIMTDNSEWTGVSNPIEAGIKAYPVTPALGYTAPMMAKEFKNITAYGSDDEKI